MEKHNSLLFIENIGFILRKERRKKREEDMGDGRKDLIREMKEEERRERKVIVCDVLLCDPPHIDMFAYTLWLHGYTGGCLCVGWGWGEWVSH